MRQLRCESGGRGGGKIQPISGGSEVGVGDLRAPGFGVLSLLTLQ